MDTLSEVFDTESIIDRPSTPIQVYKGNDDIIDDSKYARNNLRKLISTSQDALEHALDLATQSDSPRAYEVLATLISASSDLNTKLIDVHQKEKNLTTKNNETPVVHQGNITNNVVFTGTTDELNNYVLKRLEKL